MTTPLPGGWADELIWHLLNCPLCVGAKVAGTTNWCKRGKQLVALTLAERHGEDDDNNND